MPWLSHIGPTYSQGVAVAVANVEAIIRLLLQYYMSMIDSSRIVEIDVSNLM